MVQENNLKIHREGNLIIDRDNFEFKEILIEEKGKIVAKIEIDKKKISLEAINLN